MEYEKRVESIHNLIILGGEILGDVIGSITESSTSTSIGTITGASIGGPVGALVGAVAGKAIGVSLSKVGEEVKERMLSNRESEKIGTTVYYATMKIKNNLDNGKKLRCNDFFEENITNRSDADEIVEGVLFCAQREHEEKKLKYYGNLLANIAFTDTITKEQANQLISLSNNMSYRQMKLLKIFKRSEKEQSNTFLRNESYINNNSEIDTDELASILQDILDLFNKSIIGVENLGGMLVTNLASIIPSDMRVKWMGEVLYNLMELDDIDDKELEELIDMLK